MGVLIGTDSYVTVEQADEYIANSYVASDKRRIGWDRMQKQDKEVCLKNAAQELERLPYRGVRGSVDQALSFPRCFLGDLEERMPKAILHAQAEEALELACPGEDTQVWKVRMGAVEFYSIGELSERYSIDLAHELYVRTVLRSRRAQQLVTAYCNGAFEVR